MRRAINYHFLILSAVLLISGLLFLATLSAPQSLKIFGNTNYYLFNQLIAALVGLVASFVVLRIHLHFLKRVSFVLLVVNIVLLALVFIPFIGAEFWGAARWINIGGFNFQPSEFLKITSVLYLASWLSGKTISSGKKSWTNSTKREFTDFKKLFLPFLLLLAVVALMLFLQKDISTMGIIILTLMVVYLIAGTPVWHTISIFLLGLVSAIAFILSEPYRIQRILTLFNPDANPLGVGLQIKQSLIAIGSGGIWGRGLGMSTQKFGFLPQSMSDSVFAIIGEELGILGGSVVIILFLLFLYFGFRIAAEANDKFSKLTAVGVTTWIVLQAFVNITSAIGLFPLSGIPLPFFSHGGSHLIVEMIGVALLLKISKQG